MIAILSDIHGNLEALDAVLADIRSRRVDAIYCLGDLIGYGPDPLPCIERAMAWQVVLKGDHDKWSQGVDDLPELAPARHARKTILRFRQQLKVHPDRDAIRRFMMELPERYIEHQAGVGVQFVHGTLRDPVYEYLFPETIYNPREMEPIGRLVQRLCFCGHTHIAGIFFSDREDNWDYAPHEALDDPYLIHNAKTICNVGSVGQPRDGNSQACYVLWENDRIEYRRIPYDIEKTIAKIKADDDEIDGDRYRDGI